MIETFREKVEEAVNLYDVASQARCTCGENPEGHCDFCSKWAKADRFMDKLANEYEPVLPDRRLSRDEFAAAALPLCYATEEAYKTNSELARRLGVPLPAVFAKMAYDVADAMISERERRQ